MLAAGVFVARFLHFVAGSSKTGLQGYEASSKAISKGRDVAELTARLRVCAGCRRVSCCRSR